MSVSRVTMMRKGHSGEVARKPNTVVVSVPPLVKKSSKSRSFHFRYLELCRAKNLTPVPEIRSKSNATTTFLELCGDKLAVSDWQLLTEALHYDLVLQQLVVRLRRTYPQSRWSLVVCYSVWNVNYTISFIHFFRQPTLIPLTPRNEPDFFASGQWSILASYSTVWSRRLPTVFRATKI